MFGLSKEEKETARRKREAIEMATQIKNARIMEGLEKDDIEMVRHALYYQQGDTYLNVYREHELAFDYLLNALDHKDIIKANIMMSLAIKGYDYLEPLGKKYAMGYAVSGLRAHLEDFKKHWNDLPYMYYKEWMDKYELRLKSDPEEMKLFEQMHYNMSKKLEIAEKRRESELQQNYEKWYEALLLTTKM